MAPGKRISAQAAWCEMSALPGSPASNKLFEAMAIYRFSRFRWPKGGVSCMTSTCGTILRPAK